MIESIISLIQSTDPSILWQGLAVLFLIVCLSLIWFLNVKKSTAIVIASLPFLVMDGFVSFGTYTFRLPPEYTWSTQNFVMTLNLVEWIFGFKIFQNWGGLTFNSINGDVVLTMWQTLFIYLYAFSDTLIGLLVITYLIKNISGRLDYAVLISIMIVSLYSLLVSNPLSEAATAEAVVKHILFFVGNASQTQFIIVIMSAIISFLLIVILLSTVTSFLVGVAKSTVRPGMEASAYEMSFTGLSFGVAFLYSLVYIQHPDRTWYVLLPALLLYNIVMRGARGAARRRSEKREQQAYFRAMLQNRSR